MSESDSGQDKTEEATERRKEQLRKDGSIPRSKDLMMFVSTGLTFVLLYVFHDSIWRFMSHLWYGVSEFKLDLYDPLNQMTLLSEALIGFIKLFGLIFGVVVILTWASGFGVGGLVFNFGLLEPKFERLNPIKGLSKIFSMRSLVELGKSILKIALVSAIFSLISYQLIDNYLALSQHPVDKGIKSSLNLLFFSILGVLGALLIIVPIDVVYQIFAHKQQSMMTKQEVKDEYKDSEGSPEMKSKRMQMARQLTMKRMMDAMPEADVVITNPEHYSVAIKYDVDGSGAPRVIAKGVDHMAMRIREKAKALDKPLVAAPPLARAVYYSTELNHEIPAGLYLAVAKVLAYVYQLNQFKAGVGKEPVMPEDLTIPEELAR